MSAYLYINVMIYIDRGYGLTPRPPLDCNNILTISCTGQETELLAGASPQPPQPTIHP